MKSVKKIILPIVLLLASILFLAQKKTSTQYKKEQSKLETEIKDLNLILNSTTTESKASFGRVSAIKALVSKRKRYIKNLEDEVGQLEGNLSKSEGIIKSLGADVDSLKGQYANMVYHTSKLNHSFDKLLLIFSAKSYNDLSLRLNFLNQFAEVKKEQVEKIQKVQASLVDQQVSVSQKYKQKKNVLNKILSERVKLDGELVKQKQEYDILKGKEKDLRKEIQRKRRRVKLIKKLIKELLKDPVTNVKLSKEFAKNKGRLPSPLRSKNFVSSKFGQQPHPTLGGVKIDNLGIGLQTTTDAKVYSSFEGQVRRIFTVPGNGTTIMVKHGEYFTVYGRLKGVKVKPGERITAGQVLGTVKSINGTSSLDFQIWKKQKNLNPILWIKR